MTFRLFQALDRVLARLRAAALPATSQTPMLRMVFGWFVEPFCRLERLMQQVPRRGIDVSKCVWSDDGRRPALGPQSGRLVYADRRVRPGRLGSFAALISDVESPGTGRLNGCAIRTRILYEHVMLAPVPG
jgi:hypothetical protein